MSTDLWDADFDESAMKTYVAGARREMDLSGRLANTGASVADRPVTSSMATGAPMRLQGPPAPPLMGGAAPMASAASAAPAMASYSAIPPQSLLSVTAPPQRLGSMASSSSSSLIPRRGGAAAPKRVSWSNTKTADGKTKLGVGAMLGIGVAVLAVIVLIGFAVHWFMNRRSSAQVASVANFQGGYHSARRGSNFFGGGAAAYDDAERFLGGCDY